MNTRPTIIFDLDGTLADTLRDLVPALNRTLVERHINPVHAHQIGHLTGAGGLKAMIERAFRLSGQPLSHELRQELFAASVEDYRQNIAVETVLYPGVRAGLERFSDQGWLLGVCTNKPVGLAAKLLRELAVDHLFASVTGSDSYKFKKPDPRHLTRTIETAGGLASRAVMVGDTQNDILTAQKANVPVIAVDYGYSDHPLETYGPDRVISGFETLFEAAVELMARPRQ